MIPVKRSECGLKAVVFEDPTGRHWIKKPLAEFIKENGDEVECSRCGDTIDDNKIPRHVHSCPDCGEECPTCLEDNEQAVEFVWMTTGKQELVYCGSHLYELRS